MSAPLRAAALLALALLLAFVPFDPLRPADRTVDGWLASSAASAAGAYAAVRGLNASVSVLKESKLALEPGGVGVGLAVGQILDPLDDMTERLSDVIVAAIVCLGAQRILHELAAGAAGGILALVLLLAAAVELLPPERARAPRRTLRLVALGVIAARLAAPLGALGSRWTHDEVLAPRIEVARADLASGLGELDELVRLELPEEGGFLSAVSSAGKLLKGKLAAFRDALTRSKGQIEGLVDALLRLTALYVAAIALEGVVLPLLAFALLWLTGRTLLRALTRPAPPPRAAPEESNAARSVSAR